jgi:hypothetical protein
MIDLATTHVYREIHEQPAVLARLLDQERGSAAALAAEIRRRAIQFVVIAARGRVRHRSLRGGRSGPWRRRRPTPPSWPRSRS